MTIASRALAAIRRLGPFGRTLFWVLAYLFFLLCFIVIADGVLSATGGRSRLESELFFWFARNATCGFFAAFGASALLLDAVERRSFRTLGLWFYSSWASELALGLVAGLAIVSAVVGLVATLGQFKFRLAGTEIGVALVTSAGTATLLLVAAAHEELLFRGYPFQRLTESWGSVGAAVALSVLFGLVHLGNPAVTPLAVLNTTLAGVLLTLAYVKTRALWFPIGLHFGWNLAKTPVFGLPMSGRPLPATWLEVDIARRTWVSGGDYGIEGSILLTLVLIPAIIWLARTTRLAPSPQMASVLR